MELFSSLTCPECAHAERLTMPTDACVVVHECAECHARLTPASDHCCVFCSYARCHAPRHILACKRTTTAPTAGLERQGEWIAPLQRPRATRASSVSRTGSRPSRSSPCSSAALKSSSLTHGSIGGRSATSTRRHCSSFPFRRRAPLSPPATASVYRTRTDG